MLRNVDFCFVVGSICRINERWAMCPACTHEAIYREDFVRRGRMKGQGYQGWERYVTKEIHVTIQYTTLILYTSQANRVKCPCKKYPTRKKGKARSAAKTINKYIRELRSRQQTRKRVDNLNQTRRPVWLLVLHRSETRPKRPPADVRSEWCGRICTIWCERSER